MLVVKYRVSNGAGTVLALNTGTPAGGKVAPGMSLSRTLGAALEDTEEQCGGWVAFPDLGLCS